MKYLLFDCGPTLDLFLGENALFIRAGESIVSLLFFDSIDFFPVVYKSLRNCYSELSDSKTS